MRVRHPHRGFNLIELMIVIAVVAILVPTVLPARMDSTPRVKVIANPGIVADPKGFVSEYCESDPNQSFSTTEGIPPVPCFLHPAGKRITGM